MHSKVIEALEQGKEVTTTAYDDQFAPDPNAHPPSWQSAALFRKKPVTIEAIQWTGRNLKEVIDFTGKHPRWHEWFSTWEDYERHVQQDGQRFKIFTLEGTMIAEPGDWIIKGVKGEFYPCKPGIFAATYEPAQAAPIQELEQEHHDKIVGIIAEKIEAERRPAAPHGWKLVPVEPTPEMLEAGAKQVDWYTHNALDCYNAMLAAAPVTAQPTASAEPAGEVVVSWTQDRSRIVAVTRQDEEGRILSVIAVAPVATQPSGSCNGMPAYEGPLSAAQAPAADADAWKAAVDHELTALHSTADSFANPREAVRALIDWHISVERDPAVSEMAKDAARYRWLKKSAFCGVWTRGDGIALVVPRAARADIDYKIDAAMRKEGEQ